MGLNNYQTILIIELNSGMCYSILHLMVPVHFYCWVAGSFNENVIVKESHSARHLGQNWSIFARQSTSAKKRIEPQSVPHFVQSMLTPVQVVIDCVVTPSNNTCLCALNWLLFE